MSFLDKIKGWFSSSSSSHHDHHDHDDHGHGSVGAHDSRWDSLNNPQGYIPGATPGFAQPGGAGDLKKMSLALKIQEGSRMGFDFVQLDIETISELMEPELDKRAKQIQDAQQVYCGVHGPVAGNTALDLGVAYAPMWHKHHQNLLRTAYGGAMIGAKYILFHTSAQGRPAITFALGETRQNRLPLFSFSGQILGDWIVSVSKGEFEDPKTRKKVSVKDFDQWFLAKFLEVLYQLQGAVIPPIQENYFGRKGHFNNAYEAMERIVENKHTMLSEQVARERKQYMDRLAELQKKQNRSPQEESEMQDLAYKVSRIDNRSRFTELQEKALQTDRAYWEAYHASQGMRGDKDTFYEIFKFWNRSGSPADEAVAYRAVAKYMFLTGDPIWGDIVGAHIDPDHVVDAADHEIGKMEDAWAVYKGTEQEESIRKKYAGITRAPIKFAEDIIAAVCAKYIEGHLFVSGPVHGFSGLPEARRVNLDNDTRSVYTFCEENVRKDPNNPAAPGKPWPMQIFIENEQPVAAPEGELRLMRAKHHVALVKAIDNGKLTSFCLDFEHMMINMIDPITETSELTPGDGKYIKMVHMNSVVAFRAAHGPIRRLSRDMKILYDFLFNLRRSGMTNAYIIWEMGSFGVEQSAIAYRALIKALDRDLDPEKLVEGTPEYDEMVKILYGIDETFFAQQEIAIRQHALDPLKGLIMHPEEEHGFLSGEAIKKGGDKLATWVRGHLK